MDSSHRNTGIPAHRHTTELPTSPYFLNNQGLTLLELIIAITVSAALIGSVFTVYLTVLKGFKHHAVRSVRVVDMAVAKERIDAAMSDIRGIQSIRIDRLDYISESGEKRQIQYGRGELTANGRQIVKGLSQFRTELVGDTSAAAVLLWDVDIGGGWVGGAVRLGR